MSRTATTASLGLFYNLVIIFYVVVLTVMPSYAANTSILSRGSVVSGSAGSDVALRTETINRMEAIKSALDKFARANKVLPCPTLSSDNSKVAGTSASTTTPGTACAGDFTGMSTASNIVEGMVPVRTLNLPADYAYDAWGHRINYVIDRRFAHKGTVATSLGPLTSSTTELSSYNTTRAGDIQVYNQSASGKNRVDGGPDDGPAALLISYGPNGYGAYLKNGQRVPSTSASQDERSNFSLSSSAVSVEYVQRATNSSFDDIVYIIPRMQDVPFMCPDRGTVAGSYGQTNAGPGYALQLWNDPTMLMPLDRNPNEKTFYKECYGGVVNATTGATACAAGKICYSGRLERSCVISADANKTAAAWRSAGMDNVIPPAVCSCPSQTSAAGNYWYNNVSWPATTPAAQGAAGNVAQADCNTAFYDGKINRYCRGDDVDAISGGWSRTTSAVSVTPSLIGTVNNLTHNCTCKAKSVAAGVGYNAFTIPAGTAMGSSYSKTCDAPGYTGTVNFTCKTDSGYDTSATGCIQGCTAITGYTSGNQYANWTTTPINTNNVAGSCSTGLVTSAAGRPSRNCQSNSTWGAITGSCQCPTYNPGTAYSGSTGQADVGGTVDVACNTGSQYYNAANSNKGRFQCNSNGTWTVVQSCEKPCNVTDSVDNSTAAGTVSGNTIFGINWGNYGDVPRGTTKRVYGIPSSSYGGITRSVCSAGWKVGYAERQCLSTGQWGTLSSSCPAYVWQYTAGQSGSPSQRVTVNYTAPEGCYNLFVQVWAAGGGAYGTSGKGHSAQAGSMGHFGVWTNYGNPSKQPLNSFTAYIGLGGPADHEDDEVPGGDSNFVYSTYGDVYFVAGRGENNGSSAPWVGVNGVVRPFSESSDPNGLLLGGSMGWAPGGNGQGDNNDASNGCCGGEQGGYSNAQYINELASDFGGSGPRDGDCWEPSDSAYVYRRVGAGGCSIKRSSGSYYSRGHGGGVVVRCNRDVN